jgi:2-haloacid dehalogenase
MTEKQEASTFWATYDCYGTLVDWESGMYEAISRVVSGNIDQLLALYYEAEHEVEAERPFRSYREVLAETLRRSAAHLNITLAPGTEHILSNTMPNWPIFPDVGPALTALKQQGWKLAILSNVDKDLIVETLKHMPVEFDLVVTAQEVQSYKPGLPHFQRFQEITGIKKSHWVHVARSFFHDIIPAHRLGVKSVWINRDHSPAPEPLATVILPDLTQLPATLAELKTK